MAAYITGRQARIVDYDRNSRLYEPATLGHQLGWLREAGLEKVERFWEQGRSAIIGGQSSAAARVDCRVEQEACRDSSKPLAGC